MNARKLPPHSRANRSDGEHVIVVLASLDDSSAKALVRHWAHASARLMTCEDLSRKGWSFLPRRPGCGTAVIGGERVAMKHIRGVLVRLSFVTENELLHIHPEDRSYVAAEMMAFLVAWLNEMPCPVLNRPTPFCLAGPSWRPEQWTFTAAQLGIPIQPTHRFVKFSRGMQGDASLAGETDSCRATITIIGDRCFGEAEESLKRYARALAKAARVDLLSVEFTAPKGELKFLQAHVVPPLASDELRDTALAWLQRASHRSKNRA